MYSDLPLCTISFTNMYQGRESNPYPMLEDSNMLGAYLNVLLLVRVGGIEPPSQPWEGRILPLDHTRAT